MQYEIDMDGTDFTIVAVCPCGWRLFTFLRSDAWHAAAHHLKAVHGELYAARRAADAEAIARRREEKQGVTSVSRNRPDAKAHGTSGHTGTARKRATAHP